MTLRTWLAGAVGLLVAANAVAWLARNRGLVTIDARKAPLSEVARSVQRQAGIRLETNLPADTPVTLRLRRAPLTQALDALAGATDARWHFAYCLAPDQPAAESGLAEWRAGSAATGWRWIELPLPGFFGADDGAPPDPRADHLALPGNTAAQLHPLLEQATRSSGTAYLVPRDWNPALPGLPKPGEIRKVIPKLARSAGGTAVPAFLLAKSERRPRGEGDAEGRPGPRLGFSDATAGTPEAGERRRFDPAAFAERMQAEIERLPEPRRADARARFDRERAFWESLRDLPPEERRAKIAERMNDPDFQSRREERMAERDARRSPEQRLDRYRNYVERKAQAAPQR